MGVDVREVIKRGLPEPKISGIGIVVKKDEKKKDEIKEEKN